MCVRTYGGGRRYAENWFQRGDAWEAEQRRELVSKGAEAPDWLDDVVVPSQP